MTPDLDHLRRPLGLLSVSMIGFYAATGTVELLVYGETGTPTFVLSVVTAAVVVATILETRYGVR